MIEFNPDGSIKLPSRMKDFSEKKERKLKRERSMLIRKEVVSFDAPKKCVLRLTLSQTLTDNRFVKKTYEYFQEKAEVPSKLIKKNDREFEVEIGTCFRRCSDCTSLVNRFREFMDQNIIVEKSGCTYEPPTFHFEDYFD